MSFNEIEKRVEEVGSLIFRYSLDKNLSFKQLDEIYKRLLEIRDRFLELHFMEIEIDKLEQIRFRLQEEIYMVKIFICEKEGQDTANEIEKLKHLYENNEE